MAVKLDADQFPSHKAFQKAVNEYEDGTTFEITSQGKTYTCEKEDLTSVFALPMKTIRKMYNDMMGQGE